MPTITQEPKPIAVKPATPPMVMADSSDKAARLASVIADLMSGTVQPLDESRVIELIKAHSAAPISTSITINPGTDSERKIDGLHHYLLPLVLKAIAVTKNIALVGPAGSGKTHAAKQIADALGVGFSFDGALGSKYEVTGYMDAQGRYVSTAFYNTFKNGGVHLFDEMDGSLADALLIINPATSNGHMAFPDGTIVERHKDCYIMVAMNTFGRGADRLYVGRNQLDASTMDRFPVINFDYDEKLEFAIAGNDNWTRTVQKIRKAVFDMKLRFAVTPRASCFGAKLLEAGIPEKDVLDMVIWKGMDTDSKNKVKTACGM